VLEPIRIENALGEVATICLASAGAAAAFAPASAPRTIAAPRASTVTMETVDDLKSLATTLNPIVGYWDPLKLGEAQFWENSNQETIGWLRHAEIKHGRVAMAAFVGYIVHANGIHFPWKMPGDENIGMAPAQLWDGLPEAAKWQIVLGVGFLEWWSELRLNGEAHYMKGGKPGYVPNFDDTPEQLPHWMGFNLYDPLRWHVNDSAEKKQRGLITEINNGRLAQIGIIAFVSEAQVPGSVPLLKGVIPEYAGDVMQPFLNF